MPSDATILRFFQFLSRSFSYRSQNFQLHGDERFFAFYFNFFEATVRIPIDTAACRSSRVQKVQWTVIPHPSSDGATPHLLSSFFQNSHPPPLCLTSHFKAIFRLHAENVLCDEFIWEIWLISETWLDCVKLTYNTCNSTNKGSKNWSITFKGHKAVLLKAILAKTSNFWPIGPIELKFWHLILKMIHFNISLRRSHGSSFRPLWWLLLGP